MTRWIGINESSGEIDRVWQQDDEPAEAGRIVMASETYAPDTHYAAALPPGDLALAARVTHGSAAIDRLSIVADGADAATVSGLPVDVTGVDLAIVAPDGTRTIVHHAYGAGDYSFTADTPGRWQIELALKHVGFSATVTAAEAPAAGAVSFTTPDGWTHVHRTADIDHTGDAAWTDIPGLAFTPEAGAIYDIAFFVLARTSVAADGPGVGIGLPSAYADAVVSLDGPSTGVTSIAVRKIGDPAVSTTLQSASVDTAGKSYPYSGWGVLVAGPSVTGTWRLRMRIDVATSTVTIAAGSLLSWRRRPA